jgi:hypothetical protein
VSLVGGKAGEQVATAFDRLADSDADLRLLGQIKLRPRAETDQPDSLAAGQLLPFFNPTNDSPGNQARDLPHRHPSPGRLQVNPVRFVPLTARRIKGIQESSLSMTDGFNATLNGTTINMAVQDREKDDNFRTRRRAARGIMIRFDGNDLAVGGAHDGAGLTGNSARGIAEKRRNRA